eukprot:NODE_348_length_8996_cov_0.416433.p1 type:complete len:676 gc:universal NODE_348_length_8996_cov_0.416433:2335-4362(+)
MLKRLNGKTAMIYINTPCSYETFVSHIHSKGIPYCSNHHKLFYEFHNIYPNSMITSDMRRIQIQPKMLGGSADDEEISTDCSIFDKLDQMKILSYNCRGDRNGSLSNELKSFVSRYHPTILHLTKYRISNEIHLPGYNIVKFKYLNECDRQAIYVLSGIEDISLVSVDSQYCHTVKISGNCFTFGYLPPRFKNGLEFQRSQLQITFIIRSLFIGDSNQRCPSIQNGHDSSGRNFESMMRDNCYSPSNSPNESLMRRGNNCFDQVWCHNSISVRVSPIIVLKLENTTSDHYPIMFQFDLLEPVHLLRTVDYNTLRHDIIIRRQLELRLKSKFDESLHKIPNLNINEVWSEFKHIVTQTSFRTLSVTSFRDGDPTDSIGDKLLILNVRRKTLKKQLQKRGNSQTRIVNLQNGIKNLNKLIKINLMRQKDNQFNKYLDKLADDELSGYFEFCKLRRNFSKSNSNLKADLHQSIEYHKSHFENDHDSIWPDISFNNSPQIIRIANDIFTVENVTHALRTTNSRKISGDIIPSIIYKYLPGSGFEYLQQLFIKCYLECRVPDDWNVSSVVEIFKSGNSIDPGRYRPISLISICYKIYQQMLYYHIYKDQIFPSLRQHGFVGKRSCSTQIHSVLSKMQHYRESHGSVHCLALDLSTAFDCMKHNDIYNYLLPILNPHDTNS